MTTISTKTAALSVMIALGSLMSYSAQAGVIRTADGVPLMTKDGIPVVTQDTLDQGCVPASKAPVLDYVAPPKKEFDHERIVFFDFNQSKLTKSAKVQLKHLSEKIRTHKDKNITVVGYADRMGSASFNEKLALKRAKAVHDYLIAHGVKAKKMEVRSLGKSVSNTNCNIVAPRAEMISCLSSDRRVEIEIK